MEVHQDIRHTTMTGFASMDITKPSLLACDSFADKIRAVPSLRNPACDFAFAMPPSPSPALNSVDDKSFLLSTCSLDAFISGQSSLAKAHAPNSLEPVTPVHDFVPPSPSIFNGLTPLLAGSPGWRWDITAPTQFNFESLASCDPALVQPTISPLSAESSNRGSQSSEMQETETYAVPHSGASARMRCRPARSPNVPDIHDARSSDLQALADDDCDWNALLGAPPLKKKRAAARRGSALGVSLRDIAGATSMRGMHSKPKQQLSSSSLRTASETGGDSASPPRAATTSTPYRKPRVAEMTPQQLKSTREKNRVLSRRNRQRVKQHAEEMYRTMERLGEANEKLRNVLAVEQQRLSELKDRIVNSRAAMDVVMRCCLLTRDV